MRLIESKKQEEKRKKKNQIIIGLILIFIMFGSTFAVIVGSFNKDNNSSSKIDYNGYEFIESNGFWTTSISDYNFWFMYNPTQVEKIESEINYLDSYYGSPLYYFSESDAAINEVYRNLNGIVQRFQVACFQEKDCPEEWPIRDCSNNFIIIKEANESQIIQQEKCVFIEGPSENLTQITDEFLFKIIGIES